MVKGSKQEQLAIVAYSPWQRILIRLTITVLIVVVILAGYGYGQYQGWEERRSAVSERNALRISQAGFERDNEELRQKVAVLARGNEIDQKTYAEVRHTITEQNARIAQLENEVTFYKRVMTPTSEDQGLRIESWGLSKTLDPSRFNFELVLTQLAGKNSFIEGRALVSVVGTQGDTRRVLPLRDLSENVKDLGVRFRFRFFQNVSGEMVLPKGFKPEKIEIILQSTGRKAMRVEKNYEWSAQEAV